MRRRIRCKRAMSQLWSLLTRGSLRWHSFEHAAHANVLVDIGPPYAGAIAEDLVVGALLRRRIGQAPRPGERDADGPAVDEMGNNELVRDFDRGHPWIRATTTRLRRSAHATPPECGPCAE